MFLPNIHVFYVKVFVFVFTAAVSQVEAKSISARCTMDQLLFIKSSCCSFRCNAPDGHTGGHHRKILKCVVMAFFNRFDKILNDSDGHTGGHQLKNVSSLSVTSIPTFRAD